MPFYAVRQGKKPGIYHTWDECHKQVHRFAGAQYKKFNSHSDAQDYLTEKIKIQKTVETKSPTSKSKSTNNIPVNLMRDAIQKFSTNKMTTSYEKLTLTDTTNDDQDTVYTVVYSDGCCFSNGSSSARAGYGVYWDEDHPWNISERLQGDQTNQRAELTAAIRAMEVALSNGITHLEIRTDSKYTIQSATEWIRGWKRSNWIKKTDSKPVMNRDLMMKIDELQEQLQLKWTYVPGHSSNKGNDEADRLAKAGAQQK
jgi:ribonuclease HI